MAALLTDRLLIGALRRLAGFTLRLEHLDCWSLSGTQLFVLTCRRPVISGRDPLPLYIKAVAVLLVPYVQSPAIGQI